MCVCDMAWQTQISRKTQNHEDFDIKKLLKE